MLTNEVASHSFRWIILPISLFTALFAFMSLQSPPPLMPLIMEELNISYSQAGLLMTLFSLPGIFSIGCGLLIDRYGVRRLGIISILCLIMGSFIVTNSQLFEMALVGRLVAGVGTAFVSVIVPKTLAQWFSARELATAMGLGFANSMPLAVIIALILFGNIGIALGWRFPFFISSLIGVIVLVVFWGLIRESPPQYETKRKEDSHVKSNLLAGLLNLEIWKIGIVWLLFNASIIAYTTWGPTFFMEFRNISLVFAASITSLFWITQILCIPFIGWLSDRLGKRRLFVTIGCALTAFLLLLIPETSGSSLLVSIVVLGAVSSLIPPTTFTISGELLGPKRAGTSFGVLMTCLNIGIAVGPVVIGYVREATISLSMSFIAMAVFIAFATIISHLVKTR